MGYERLAWVGNLVLAGIAILLAWLPVKEDVGRWGTAGIAVLVLAAAVLLFPRRSKDGSTGRLIDTFSAGVRGNDNNTQIARDHAKQTMTVGRRDDKKPPG